MSAPTTVPAFLALVRKSGLLDEEVLARLNEEDLPSEPFPCAEYLVRTNVLTAFQATHLMSGRYRGLLLGPYRILRALGKGGMGVVYLADHVGLNRKVALKVLTADKGNEKLSLERFHREARAAAALDHPHIVRVHDVAQADGRHFLVMEYVEGVDLQSLVEQTGPLHYAQAANYVAQAAAGLQHAHETGFIHRDIKPGNLMLAKDGTVKILDMGLARSVTDPKDDLTGKLDEDHITGTVDFLSPEQALNVALDTRSDIYSLGATLYALISGNPPYGGTTTQKLTQHQLAPTPDLCKNRAIVPAGLGAVVSRMMAKRPSARYQTAQEVIEALAPWVTPVPDLPSASTETPAPRAAAPAPIPAPEPEKESPKPVEPKEVPTEVGRKQWIAVGAVVLLVAVIGAVLAFGRGKKPEENTQPPPQTPVSAAPAPNPTPVPALPERPNPAPKGPVAPPEVVAYRLDLSRTKPFVLSNTGRTVGTSTVFEGAPEGWGSHSWYPECTHELFAESRGGQMALGLRFTAKPANNGPAGMLFVGGIDVVPNRAYTIRVTYQANGGYTTGDVRARELQGNRLRIVGKNQLTQTGGEWTTVALPHKNGSTDKVQFEFHHNGPLGAENDLLIRGLELVEDPRSPG